MEVQDSNTPRVLKILSGQQKRANDHSVKTAQTCAVACNKSSAMQSQLHALVIGSFRIVFRLETAVHWVGSWETLQEIMDNHGLFIIKYVSGTCSHSPILGAVQLGASLGRSCRKLQRLPRGSAPRQTIKQRI